MESKTPAPDSYALVTGGSAGLGAAGARLFAANGMRVIVNYSSNTERAEALLAELHAISGPPGRHRLIQADMGDRAQIQAMVAEAAEWTGGRLDAVFSNHGYTRVRGWKSLDDNVFEEDWDRCFNLNVKSHLWLMHAAKPYLEAAEGCMVVSSSLTAVRPGGSSLAYSVTKAALNHLVKGLAILAAPKIRVNAVCPGLMLTEWGMRAPEEARQSHLDRTKLKRLVTPEDTAEQVLCFVKNKGITGTHALIDAGWCL